MSKRNFNPNVVVMTAETYQQLLILAEAGTCELGESRYNKIIKKIRRFNQSLIDRHQLSIKKEKYKLQIIKSNVKYLLRYTGKTVYLLIDKNMFAPIRILSTVNSVRDCKTTKLDGYLRCKVLVPGENEIISVPYYNIITELPENHAPITDGEFKGCFIFPDGYLELNQSTWLRKPQQPKGPVYEQN